MTDNTKQFYSVQPELMKREVYKEFQQVLPGLYIGSQISSLSIPKLLEHNIKHILRVNGITEKFAPYSTYGIRFHVLDIDDMPDYPIAKHFQEAYQFIEHAYATDACDGADGCGCVIATTTAAGQGTDQSRQSKGGVLIVCTAGISRSAAIVMSYLIKKHKMPYEKALQTVKKARMFVQPNVGFERVLKEYAKKHSCDLCWLEKKTQWFEQYGNKRYGDQLFRVLICDSCECPMVVYTASHKQQLSTEELYEAFNLCEDVGNDYFGQGRWFIEGKQRAIGDHFHWHVREMKVVNDIIAIRMLGKDPQIGDSLNTMVKEGEPLESIPVYSKQLITQHLQTSNYLQLEKRVQLGLASSQMLSQTSFNFRIESRVRFNFEGIVAIEQSLVLLNGTLAVKMNDTNMASMQKHIVAKMYFRIKVIQDQKLKITGDMDILAKL